MAAFPIWTSATAAATGPPGEPSEAATGTSVAVGEPVQEERFPIWQYRITGSASLKRAGVEAAVYPFMGPLCSGEQVEMARKALELAYRQAGYALASVSVPPQDARHGVIRLEVSEGRVGRLRVKGARYFLPEKVRKLAPSVQPGKVLNFDAMKEEILALNRHPDRQVTPDVKPGLVPGTWDVELLVKDQSSLHGSLEFNNRYSPDTTEYRINGALSYSNLWQAGHTLGMNFQVAPERPEDASVWSGYYILPLRSGTTLMVSGTIQDSDINTLGGASVGGNGYVIGTRLNFTLPPGPSYAKSPLWYHSLSLGVDFKNFEEDVAFGGTTQATPIEYIPFTMAYSGTWAGSTHSTDLNAAVSYGIRGGGSDPMEFDAKRYLARGNYIHFRGDLSHTHDLPGGLEAFAKVQGQVASGPLINSEQASGGGLGNARGYLESTVLGDNAVFGTVELRSPDLFRTYQTMRGAPTRKAPEIFAGLSPAKEEWRVYLFGDAGHLTLDEPLPGQEDAFSLVSVGVGSRMSLRNHFHGSLDAGLPLRNAGVVQRGDWLLTFRLWTDF